MILFYYTFQNPSFDPSKSPQRRYFRFVHRSSLDHYSPALEGLGEVRRKDVEWKNLLHIIGKNLVDAGAVHFFRLQF